MIERAIAYEDTMSEMHGHGGGHGAHEHGAELFSRGVQANVGMGFGLLVFAAAMGALLAVLFCIAHGRVGTSPAPAGGVAVGGDAVVRIRDSGAEVPTESAGRQPGETLRQRTCCIC